MRIEEAEYVGSLVLKLASESKGPVLNIGSSTEQFRKTEQPHVDACIFAPLRSAGVKIIHSDLKQQEGVDIAGDIFEPGMQGRLQSVRPSVILACNLMEHLRAPMRRELPATLDRILNPGGYLVITVPFSYPLHLDPIDTYYRPSPEQLCLLFPSYEVVDRRVIVGSTYLSEFRKSAPLERLRLAVRVAVPFYRPAVWLCIVHRLFWLFRPYKVSCVTLRKGGGK